MKGYRSVTLSTVVVWLASLALASAAHAQSPETGFRGRIWVGTVGRYVLTDNEAFSAPPFGTVALHVDGSAFGFGGDLEYKFNRRLGLDVALGYTKLPVQFQSSLVPNVTQNAEIGLVPLLFALNLHVVSNEKVDIWFGPQVGWVFFTTDELAFVVPGAGVFAYPPANVFTPLGFNVGLDVSLSKALALNLAFRWQNADADSDGHLTIDPTFVTIGMTFRF